MIKILDLKNEKINSFALEKKSVKIRIYRSELCIKNLVIMDFNGNKNTIY